MKNLLTLLVLCGSIVMVGCHNPRKNAEKFLGIVKDHAGGTGTNICTKYGWHGCKDNLDAAELLIVEEDAENGKDRVILKFRTYTGWKYIGIDLSQEDIYSLNGLSNEDLVEDIIAAIDAGFDKYGYLKFEPGDEEFFFFNDDTYLWELFSETSQAGKDLELMGAKVEDNNATQLGERLATQYGLSEDRSQVIAKTMSAYNKLISKRALTAYEKNQFSNTLLGVDYKAAERGLMSGDAQDFDALMEQAAEANGTSPEAVSAIIKDMIL